jgi:mannosyltransferase
VLALGCALRGTRLTARDTLWLVAGHALVALAWVPALAILADQAPAWIGSTWLRFSADRLFLARLASLYALPGWPIFAAILLAGVGLARLWRAPGARGAGATLFLLAVLPVLLAIAASVLVAPVFLTRTLRPVAVPAILLIAAGVAGGGRQRWWATAMAILLGAALAWAGVAARRGPPMQDWVGTVAWLRRHAAPTDLVLAYPNEGALPLAFALRDAHLDLSVRPVPAPVPSLDVAQGDYPNGTRGVPRLAPARLRAIAADPALARVRTVWLLRLAGWTYDPGDVFLTALRRERTVVRTWRSGPIEIVGLRSRPAPVRNRR